MTRAPLASALLLSATLSVGLAACGNADTPARSGRVVTSGEAQIGGDWEMVNTQGQTVTDDDFLGKPQLIYFGFTFCPDVCPVSLSKMGAIAERIDPEGDDFHYLFFSVDPERDTPGALSQYVTSNGFAPGLVGLTGTPEQAKAAQDAFKIYAARVEDAGASDYLYDHSDYIIVLDREGRFHDLVSNDDTVDAASAELRRDFRL